MVRKLALAAMALSLTLPNVQAREPINFYPLPPCPVFDTRAPPGPNGGPKLNANTTRCFQVQGICGVPSFGCAASFHLTALEATDSGSIRIFPDGTVPAPGVWSTSRPTARPRPTTWSRG